MCYRTAPTVAEGKAGNTRKKEGKTEPLLLPPPSSSRMQVAREGTKKTVFTNFMELCKSMNRNHEHVQAFLLAELGTSGGWPARPRHDLCFCIYTVF